MGSVTWWDVQLKAAKYIEHDSSFSEEKQSKALKISCKLNCVARAQAYSELVDLDLTELDIKKALKIDHVKLVYKTLKEKMRECNIRDAKFYDNMFAKWRKLQVLALPYSWSSST
ncbi:hypothetical protein PVAP13_6KG140612 [Panicum virgatum]|uniref:Uncharacterized protein n=1 Tax=Panicum virgatum TaxID=38727 RepID=A0A8T0RET8_PANVG|nr:hypothetical protein PVAP13_6KG140612 [Panicum virgatum]